MEAAQTHIGQDDAKKEEEDLRAAIAESLAEAGEGNGDDGKGAEEAKKTEEGVELAAEEKKEEEPAESAIFKMFGGWKKKLYDEKPVLAPDPVSEKPKEAEAEEQI